LRSVEHIKWKVAVCVHVVKKWTGGQTMEQTVVRCGALDQGIYSADQHQGRKRRNDKKP